MSTRVIWKFGLGPIETAPRSRITLQVPRHSHFLRLGKDLQGLPCLWYEVSPNEPEEPIELLLVWTGVEMGATPARHRYLGTFTSPNIPLIYHVYELCSE